jgi:hypothetical protein
MENNGQTICNAQNEPMFATSDEWIPHILIRAILDLIEERMNEISNERPAKRTRHEAEENPVGEHVSVVVNRCEHRCDLGQGCGFAVG